MTQEICGFCLLSCLNYTLSFVVDGVDMYEVRQPQAKVDLIRASLEEGKCVTLGSIALTWAVGSWHGMPICLSHLDEEYRREQAASRAPRYR